MSHIRFSVLKIIRPLVIAACMPLITGCPIQADNGDKQGAPAVTSGPAVFASNPAPSVSRSNSSEPNISATHPEIAPKEFMHDDGVSTGPNQVASVLDHRSHSGRVGVGQQSRCGNMIC